MKTSTSTNAALLAAAHSAWITALAVFGGLLSNWYATGMQGPFLSYLHANLIGWLVTNLIAPFVRAYLAKRNADLGVPATTPDTPATPPLK